MGMGLYGVKPLRLGYQNRKRIPRFFHRDDLNVPDVMQRVHWDPEFARRSGNPTTFDYGRMRETWLIHLCTDWMGDDAWLWKLECEFREVQLRRRHAVAARHASCASTSRRVTGPRSISSSRAENQRGEVTTPGTATILLPSREARCGAPARPARRRARPHRSARCDLRRSSRRADDRCRARSPTGSTSRSNDGVLRLTLDRPEKRNAISDAMMAGLIDGRDRGRRPTSACA